MEPQHITEFASQRYFEKLDQEARQRAAAATASGTAESSTTTIQAFPESPFILPLRGVHVEQVEEPAAKASDQKQKSRFLGSLRFKSHSKPPPTIVEQPIQYIQQTHQLERRTSLAESTKTRYVDHS